MNRERRIIPATSDHLLTADAKTVTGAEFYNALFPDAAERRAKARDLSIRYCINAIKRGDTYGFPPSLVAECREMIARGVEPQPVGKWRIVF